MFGARHGFRVCTGAHYFGSYVGDDKYKSDWLRERTLTWDKNINTISKTTGKYPQEIYASVVCVIQSEWIFLQHVTLDTGDLFAGVEKIICENVLLRLLFGNTKILSPVVGSLSKMRVRKA